MDMKCCSSGALGVASSGSGGCQGWKPARECKVEFN